MPERPTRHPGTAEVRQPHPRRRHPRRRRRTRRSRLGRAEHHRRHAVRLLEDLMTPGWRIRALALVIACATITLCSLLLCVAFWIDYRDEHDVRIRVQQCAAL